MSNNGWIKYSEQKPEKDGKYFFAAEVYEDRVDPNFYVYWDEVDAWASVSHFGNIKIYWMPIPELPKKEET